MPSGCETATIELLKYQNVENKTQKKNNNNNVNRFLIIFFHVSISQKRKRVFY